MVSLVIAGQGGVGKRTLASRAPKQGCGVPGCSVTGTDSVWSIDNKYFTAEVEVEIVRAPDDVEADKESCEGLVLLFDVNDETTFQFLEQWVTFIEDVDPAVLLCVANKADIFTGKDLDAAMQIWQDWCLDHGLELVVCSVLKDELEASRDAEGLPRIFEAISNHTWTGYSMKSQQNDADTTRIFSTSGASADGPGGDQAAATPSSSSVIDYRKFDAVQDQDDEAPALPKFDLRDLPRPSGRLVPLELDAEVEAWLQDNAPSEEESEVLEELLTQLRAPDVTIDKFFRDSSSLSSMDVGPNATTHVNQEEVLPKIATMVQRTQQLVKETPSLLRLGARYSLWARMAAARGSLAAELPLAVAWCQLESSAAESTVAFYKRLTLSREALAAWVDEAVVPALLRCMQPDCRPSDYLRELLASAAELKEQGNAFLKDARLADALQAYSMAVKILEQLYVQRHQPKAAPRPDNPTPPSQFTVETVEEASGQPVGPDGWPRFLLKEAREMTVALHLNSAACALKQPRQHEAAVQHCTYALALDPRNPKGYYRRGMAFLASPSREEDAGMQGSDAGPHANGAAGGRVEEEAPKFEMGGRSEQPPREALLSWAVRDLEKAKELVDGKDGLIEEALKKAKTECTQLARQRLQQDGSKGGETLLEPAEDEDDKDLTSIIDKLRAARVDGQNMTDEQRRARAAAAAKQAAAFLGMDEEEGDSSDEDR